MKKLLIAMAIALGIANTAFALILEPVPPKGKPAGYYKAILAKNPENWTARSYMGVVLIKSGDMNGARKQLALIEAGCGTHCESWKRLAGWLVYHESLDVDEIAED